MSYQFDSSGAIRDQSLVGDTLVLAEGHCRALIKSTLSGGILKFAQPKEAAGIVMSELKDCLVDAVKPQRDSNFFLARFINCQFHGVFSGIDFGQLGSGEAMEDYGTVEGCDFSRATLDSCRFFNVDMSTQRLPGWPHVVVPKPSQRSLDVAKFDWPGKLGLYMKICTDKPPSLSATVLHAPALSRLLDCTEEQIRDAFERFGGVNL